jgi:hypothetical protein
MATSRRDCLAISCVAAIVFSTAVQCGAQSAGATPASQLAALTSQLRIGSEFFLNRRGGSGNFAARHLFGRGQALYFGSALTLGYFKRNTPILQQWIISPATQTQANALVEVKKASGTICFRGLAHPSGPVAILSNWGGEDTVVVSFRGDYAVSDALTGTRVQVTHEQGTTVATVTLPAGAVRVLKADTATR